ncbi:MAG TPA: hypothetical protein VNJ09_01410 [Chthonomonadales bacterium]|nr:hypothetical protein [Chthonomonadales bacterium]
MKREIPPELFYVIIALLVIGVGWGIWYFTEAPLSRPGADRAQFFEVERQAKKNGVDLRKDPFVAMEYYKYHPEEKPPGGELPNPMAVGAKPAPGGAGQVPQPQQNSGPNANSSGP